MANDIIDPPEGFRIDRGAKVRTEESLAHPASLTRLPVQAGLARAEREEIGPGEPCGSPGPIARRGPARAYSRRSAIAGSTAAARRAGIQLASAATAASERATAP